MPPVSAFLGSGSNFQLIRQQWQNPRDIFSLLLIIGGDIVQKAIAQMSGGPYGITPVAFSFGWVSYSILAVMSVLGDGSLMPQPDTPGILINTRKGIVRQNHSWVLGRILRDWYEKEDDPKHALEISICRASTKKAGIPRPDFVWYFGVAVILLQFIIAAIPTYVHGEWSILILTFIGTVLSITQASLPQWRLEKWSCRDNFSSKVTCLTQGNGSRRVIVIFSEKGAGLDLEDLASPRTEKRRSTLPITLFFCICWLALLLTATGLENYTWYLFGISGIGMAHNVLTVAVKREPSAFGLHLKKEMFICPGGPDNIPNKVMSVIQATEKYVPGHRIGASLLDVFFPGGLHPNEVEWREAQLRKYSEKEASPCAEKGIPLCLGPASFEP
ncbi:hypothetical protein CPB86DRAFT_790222 [Serendipita vermifera]|nr:hypothetical protein CPB86DRAFT_790222 [Serendipita vermifera]